MEINIKQIKIIHLALLGGSFMFFMVVNYIAKIDYSFDFNHLDVLDYLPFPFLVLGMIISKTVNLKLLENYNEEGEISKIENYHSRVVVRSALIEGWILFTIVIMFITLNGFHIVTFILGWFYLLSIRPSQLEFEEDYKLSFEEKSRL